MSDLESVRHARDAIITEVAGGKLRSLARGGGDQASDEGLLDAFAEIFARMSETRRAAPSAKQTEASDDLANPSSDSSLESETQSQRDDCHQHCVAVKLDDLSTEDAGVSAISVVAIASVNDVGPQQVEDVATLADSDTENYSATPLATDALDADAETPVIIEEQVFSGEAGEDFVVRRPKVKLASLSKSADVNPLPGMRDGEKVAAGSSDPEAVPAEIEEKLEKPMEKFGGEQRRNRRARHHAEQSQAPASPNARREAVSLVDPMMRPGNHEVGTVAENATRVGSVQRSTAATALNRSAHAAAAVSSISSNGGSNTSRFGATEGNGVRGLAQNPLVDATAKTSGRPVIEARGKTVDTSDTLTRVKLIQRVSKAFQHLGPEGGVIRLRLAPAEMGSVRVEMRIQQRKVAARVIAETEAASAALREHLPDLRARLESFGMQVEQLDIETDNLDHDGDSNFEDPTFRDEGWQESGQRQQRRRAKQFQTKNTVDVSQDVSPAAPTTSLSAGIDVKL
ncbi:MAG: hypothetical protein CBE43_03880 [Rhodopirellula sp. TMED283]|nr:MAG: hypothetical protein CBE43_03880 [Rhodopirellula sp. TMED283]